MQKYEIQGVIGEGAYGVVMRCKNTETQETVAIKKFKETEDDEIVRKTTMRQVKILKMLNQTNIIQLKEAFRKKGIVCLVFEYVHNNLLEVLQKTPNGLEPELIRSLMYQLMKGLAYLHSMNIIHRDIKPENLLVSEKKVLKICDFGFARVLRPDDEPLTDYVATRWYRPPELLVGAHYGKEVDMWAVGSIFGELVDGQPMFPGENQLDQLFLIQKCLGNMTPEHQDTFIKNPRFMGMKFPEITSLDTIQKRYLGKMSSKALSFVKCLLKMNPADRLTAIQALRHPYFDGIREEDYIRRLQSATVAQQRHLENRVISASSAKEEPHIRKPWASPYNPPTQKQLMSQQYHHEDQNQHSPGHSRFHETNYNHNGKKSMNRKTEEEVRKSHLLRNEPNPYLSNNNPLMVTNGYSKSVNKTGGNKANKIKQKTLSLEKHQHLEALARTQGGFYIQAVEPVIEDRKEDQQSTAYAGYARTNKIYGASRSPKNNNLAASTKNKPMKKLQTTEEDEFQNVFQSTGQLPFLIMGKKAEQGIHNNASSGPNGSNSQTYGNKHNTSGNGHNNTKYGNIKVHTNLQGHHNNNLNNGVVINQNVYTFNRH